MKQHIPNILTYARLVLCLVMFVAFLPIASAVMGMQPFMNPRHAQWIILISFVVAAATDFVDGYLARRWNVVSMTGAILDPIADKVLICGAILGLCAVASEPLILLPGGIILFREFAISALREVLAPKGIKLPVTFLAKTKTTLQLVSIAALMIVLFWNAWGIDADPGLMQIALGAAKGMFAFAAVITVWTGIEYGLAARKALRANSYLEHSKF